MSGHSKWAQIRRQKGVADARRGQVFTKLAREIIVAVRQGGPNPEGNARLRLAIQKARDHNMPLDNIERAISRGSGTGEGASLQELLIEGYGPSGAAIMVEAVTDNRNRTIQEARSVFTHGGGSIGESGCASWAFESHGVITVSAEGTDAEELALEAIDAGASDVKVERDYVEVNTQPQDMDMVRRILETKGFSVTSAEVTMVPRNPVTLDEQSALRTLRLLERLEELDDEQRVFSNVDFPDTILEKLHA
jgi:YebC/PmpR family DNA-binding regulatory protein